MINYKKNSIIYTQYHNIQIEYFQLSRKKKCPVWESNLDFWQPFNIQNDGQIQVFGAPPSRDKCISYKLYNF